ncbi:MAG: 4Fe-4S dicluster domain-containing protein [candidate division KSB1 bacterium]|nr:4Fe-4S dicluster domain-containing protein [candidate division KSB1 bacterium]
MEATPTQKPSKGRGRVVISFEDCKGCGLCIEVCPPQVLRFSETLNRMGYHPAEYIGIECTGCGVCFYVCPEPGAITVYKRVEAKARPAEMAG